MLEKSPIIGILCWEEGCYARGLEQLEELPGNSTNPQTFEFPVRYCRVRGANVNTIVDNPSHDILEVMIYQVRKMEEDGIKAITTSCGFNAVFQRELANSVNIPVFTSSLMQVPMVRKMLKEDQVVGVITACKPALTNRHLENVGIDDTIALYIEGMDSSLEWSKISSTPKAEIDVVQVKKDVVRIACSMKRLSNIGAFVLECTDLPPFADAIRKATRCPVFDFVTLTNVVYEAIKLRC